MPDPLAERYARDAQHFEDELARDRKNTRAAFYLAQSYRDSGQIEKAIDAYRYRASLGGWDEEVWYSLFQIAALLERVHPAPLHGTIVEAYLDAYNFRPTRAESLCYLARFYRTHGKYRLAYHFAREASNIRRPAKDRLFIDWTVYTWRSLDEWAVAAYYVGEYELARVLNHRVLDACPEDQLSRVRENLAFCEAKLTPKEFVPSLGHEAGCNSP